MGYIGAGPTRFNTADELTVTGDAEFNGDLTVKGTHITLDSATVQTVDLGDNDKIRLGDSDDLQIYHDGSGSIIYDNGTGPLNLQTNNSNINIKGGGSASDTMAIFKSTEGVDLYYNNVKKFETTATGVDVTGTVTMDGATTSGNINFGDNDSAVFGAGNDLTINHDGSNSFITDSGTGSLYIQGTSGVFIRSADGGENFASFTDDGAVTLYHDNATKLATTATGVDVTGSLSVEGSGTGLSINSTNDEVKKILFENSGSATGYIGSSSSSPIRLLDSSATERMRIDSSGNVKIGDATTDVTSKLTVSGNGSVKTGTFMYDGSAGTYFDINTNAANGIVSLEANARSGNFPPLAFITGGTESFRINSNGSLTATASLTYPSGNGPAWGATYITGHSSSHFINFFTNATERVRIDSSGNVLVGTTSNTGSGASSGKQVIQFNGAIGNALYVDDTRTASGNDTAIIFGRGTTNVGQIQTTLSSTSYNTSSDYRLKENVTATWDATTRLKQLNPVRFNFIADADTTVDGFLAHEVQSVVSEAITGTHNGMRDEEYQVSAATGDIYTPATEAVLDEDGNEVTPAVAEVIHSTDVERPEELAEGQQWRETTAAVMGTRSVPDYQGIDQSKLVPLLVKTIQELEARIVALETA